MNHLPRPPQQPSPAPFLQLLQGLLLALAIAAGPALARDEAPREGVDVGNTSRMAKLVPAEQVEREAAQQYQQMKQEAAQKRALGSDNNPQVIRLRAIAKKMLPFASRWNDRAKAWQWEVNLIGSNQINAFCMPGGKIMFYTGILDTLKMTDDEVAAVMGHEIAHALREHARARMGKAVASEGIARIGSALLSSIFGINPTITDMATQGVKSLANLKFSRDDETEADLVGLELMARAGYDPRAGVSLWEKMQAASKGAPPQWMSTHPASENRIREIQRHLPDVMPLYERAKRGR